MSIQRSPVQRLWDHLAASRGIVDLAAAAADEQENGGVPMVDPASIRRALREALRQLEQAEEIISDPPDVQS